MCFVCVKITEPWFICISVYVYIYIYAQNIPKLTILSFWLTSCTALPRVHAHIHMHHAQNNIPKLTTLSFWLTSCTAMPRSCISITVVVNSTTSSHAHWASFINSTDCLSPSRSSRLAPFTCSIYVYILTYIYAAAVWRRYIYIAAVNCRSRPANKQTHT